MNRRIPLIDNFYFVKGKTQLQLPMSGDPCTLFVGTDMEAQCCKMAREDQYIKKIRDNSIIEEGRQNNKITLLRQELQAYFETLRKLQL